MYRFASKRLLIECFKNCWMVFVWSKSDNKQATYENNSKGPSFRNSFILGHRSGVFILRMALSIASAVILHFSFRSRSRFWFVSRPKINNKMKCSRPSRGSWSEGKAISWWMNERLFILLLYFDGFSHPFNFGHMFIASPPGGTWIRFHWNHSTWICFEWKHFTGWTKGQWGAALLFHFCNDSPPYLRVTLAACGAATYSTFRDALPFHFVLFRQLERTNVFNEIWIFFKKQFSILFF